MPAEATIWAGASVMSRSSKRTLPPEFDRTPVSTLISVVLPAPFGPMTEKMRPPGIANDTDCTARTPPKFFDRPSIARIVGVIGRCRTGGFLSSRPRAAGPSGETLFQRYAAYRGDEVSPLRASRSGRDDGTPSSAVLLQPTADDAGQAQKALGQEDQDQQHQGAEHD